MRLYSSSDVLCADNPQFLTIGWICVKTEKIWEITIQNYRSSIKLGDPDSIKMLDLAMSLAKDRSQIIDLLDKLPFLKRLNNLKVFY
jgi:hypothetical protein